MSSVVEVVGKVVERDTFILSVCRVARRVGPGELGAESMLNILDGPVYEVWQQRPYTAVRLVDVQEREAFGFTKVCWPDEWSERVGVERALHKAAESLFRQMQSEMEGLPVHMTHAPTVVEISSGSLSP